jgi:hypothetical protein
LIISLALIGVRTEMRSIGISFFMRNSVMSPHRTNLICFQFVFGKKNIMVTMTFYSHSLFLHCSHCPYRARV